LFGQDNNHFYYLGKEVAVMAKLLCLLGLPGAGKSTVLYRLYEEHPNDLIFVPRVTDRSVRPDELSPERNPEYNFVSQSWFEALTRTNCFVAVELFNGYAYGVRKSDLEVVFSNHRPGIMMPGYCAIDIKKQYPEQTLLAFLSVPGIDYENCVILPKGEQCLRARMTKRGDDSDKLETRIQLARQIIEKDRLHLQADHILVKDDEGGSDAIAAIKNLLGI